MYEEKKLHESSNYMDRWILSFTQSLLLFVKKEMDGKSDPSNFLTISFMKINSVSTSDRCFCLYMLTCSSSSLSSWVFPTLNGAIDVGSTCPCHPVFGILFFHSCFLPAIFYTRCSMSCSSHPSRLRRVLTASALPYHQPSVLTLALNLQRVSHHWLLFSPWVG